MIKYIFKKYNLEKKTYLILIDLFLIIFANLILIPLITKYNNQIDLLHFYYFPLFHLSILAIIFLFIIFCILSFFKKVISNKFFIYFVHFLLVWSILVGMWLPLGGEYDMLIINNFKIHIVILILFKIFLSIFILYYLYKNSFYNFFRGIVIIYFTLNFLFYLLTTLSYNHHNFDKLSIYSNKENFLVISFDGISSSVINTLIKNDKKVFKQFKDFVSYKNFISQFPGTYGSMLYEIYGGFDTELDYKNFNQKNMFDHIVKNSIKVNDQKINLQTYAQFGAFFKGFNKRHLAPYLNNLSSNDYFYYFFKEVNIRSFSRTIPHFVNIKIYNLFDSPNFQNFFFNSDKKLSNTNNETINDFYYLKNNIKVDNKKDYTYKFLHFNFSHSPISFDKDCKNRHYDQSWINKEFHFKNQEMTKCIIKLLTQYIVELKKQNLYSKTTLIIKSDHGRERYYYKRHPYNQEINNNKNFSYGRYNPFLMVKLSNTNREKIFFNNTNIYSNDLSYFYCVNMLRSNCDNYKIQFDFQKNVRLKDNINAEVFIPKNERSYVFLNELEPIYIDKNKDTLLNILIKKSKK